MSINVDPKEYTTTKTIKSFEIRILNISLNQSATINVLFYGDGGEYVKNETFSLVNPDYQLWTSDEWLINYVADKYGLTIVN